MQNSPELQTDSYLQFKRVEVEKSEESAWQVDVVITGHQYWVIDPIADNSTVCGVLGNFSINRSDTYF